MPGITHHPLANIQALRRILKEQYPVTSIVKELIQNAEDSHARSLHIGVDPGNPDAKHPLLRGPSLLILNDGAFTEADAEAIPRLGLGSKGADQATIGKFGLGLKSVFHICEAFFFAASANQEGSQGEFSLEILNPWASETRNVGGLHDGWNDLTLARAYVDRQLQAWQHGAHRWFCLWLPLRRENQLEGKDPIVHRQHEIADLLDSDLPIRVANCFPLLKHLGSVSVWGFREGSLTFDYTVKLADGSSRALRDELAVGDSRELAGRVVQIDSRRETGLLEYFGLEQALHCDALVRLSESEDWPKTIGINERTAAPEPRKEKADPHCAVVFSRNLTAVDGLRVSHGVVLPLADPLHARGSGKQAEFQLLLHGGFFLDGGRKALLPPARQGSGAQDEESAEVRWNLTLEEVGLLPEMPAVLGRFVEHVDLSSEKTLELTKHLDSCPWLSARREHLGKRYQWVLTVTPDKVEWQLLPSGASYRFLPGVDYRLPFKALPGLAAVASNVTLTLKGSPRLTSRPADRWGSERRWLEGLNFQDLIDHPEHVDYLTSFLKEGSPWADGVLIELTNLCRSWIANNGVELIESNERLRESFKGFLRQLAAGSWVRVGKDDFDKKQVDRIVRQLNGTLLNRLVLPEILCPPPSSNEGTPATARFEPDEAASMLSGLVPRECPLNSVTRSAVAFWVLRNTRGELGDKRAACGDIPLFRIERESNTKRASWNELVKLTIAGSLVTESEPQLYELMQAAIPSFHLCQLREGPEVTRAVLLSPNEQIHPLNKEQCFKILGNSPELGNVQSRAALLDGLLPHSNISKPETNRWPLRYLLHGQQEDAGAILLCAGRSSTQAMAKLISHLLTKRNDEWRLVDPSLTRVIADQHWDLLGMKEFSPTLATELVRETGTLALEDLPLSPSEQEELLIALRDADFWLDLPLHRADGRDPSIRANGPSTYYLRHSYEVPAYLADRITILATPNDPGLAQLYDDHVLRGDLREWGPKALLEVTLGAQDCHRHADRILSALQDCPQGIEALPDGLKAKLRSRPWLPTRNGGSATSPQRVITITGLESTIERLERRKTDDEAPTPLVDIGSLDESITEHALFDEVKTSILLSPIESATTLADELVQLPEYRVGCLNLAGAVTVDLKTVTSQNPVDRGDTKVRPSLHSPL